MDFATAGVLLAGRVCNAGYAANFMAISFASHAIGITSRVVVRLMCPAASLRREDGRSARDLQDLQSLPLGIAPVLDTLQLAATIVRFAVVWVLRLIPSRKADLSIYQACAEEDVTC
jgi:hypothetical protein